MQLQRCGSFWYRSTESSIRSGRVLWARPADLGCGGAAWTTPPVGGSKEVAAKLTELGVDMAQGFAYGKAIPLARFFEELESRLDREGGIAQQSV